MKQYYILATIIILIISFGSCTNDIENPDIIPIDKGQKNRRQHYNSKKKSKASPNKEVHIKRVTN